MAFPYIHTWNTVIQQSKACPGSRSSPCLRQSLWGAVFEKSYLHISGTSSCSKNNQYCLRDPFMLYHLDNLKLAVITLISTQMSQVSDTLMLFISFLCWKYEHFSSYRCFSFHWQKFCSSVNWCWQLAFRPAVPRSPWKKESFTLYFMYFFFLILIRFSLSLHLPPSLPLSFLWDGDFDFWNKGWGTLLMALNLLSSAEDNFELLI